MYFTTNFIQGTSAIQATLVAVVVACVIYMLTKKRNLPPGPMGLPLLGYWPFLETETSHLQLHKLQKKYGDVFTFTSCGRLIVSLGSLKVIREAHLTKADYFGDRCLDYSVLTYPLLGGVGFVNGEAWRTLRKFFTQAFKELGLTVVKDEAAGCVYDTVKETIEEMNGMQGQPIDVAEFYTLKCLRINRRILFNDQGITDEELIELNKAYEPVVGSMTPKNILLMGNLAKYFIYPLMSSHRNMLKGNESIERILTNVIERHKINYDEKQISDIIDSFLKERNERKRKGDPSAVYFTDKALLASLHQFAGDGILTVAYFIGIYLYSLVQHMDEQEKVYREIMEVVGSERLPTLGDKSKLPYTNAFFQEVMRNSEIFTYFPSQQCTRETTVNGFTIPVGAITVINLWSSHHDERVYDDPDEFKPSRFLSTPGKPRAELPIGFGVGKRACMGEAFTLTQIFLFVTAIVQNFHLAVPPDSQDLYDMFFKQGKLKICAHPRKHKGEAST